MLFFLFFTMFLDFGSDAGVYFLQRSNTTISSTVKVVAKQKKCGLQRMALPFVC